MLSGFVQKTTTGLGAGGARRTSVEWMLVPSAYETVGADFWTTRVAVVFDVLRATSTVAAWLAAGASGILPCRTVEEARRAQSEIAGAVLLGERNGLPPKGFDHGNSPLEATAERAAGRDLVMTTTNGTRALAAVAGARRVVAGCLGNAAAVAAFLRAHHKDDTVVMVLAGTGAQFALEDAVGAAWLLRHLGVGSPWQGLVAGGVDSLPGLLAASANGRRLAALGLDADVAWCARADHLDVVPVLHEGMLRTARS
jgi:2-phosphosulfolactate phosphatase